MQVDYCILAINLQQNSPDSRRLLDREFTVLELQIMEEAEIGQDVKRKFTIMIYIINDEMCVMKE